MNKVVDGILLVDKEEGLTSHGVVSLVKRVLGGSRAPKVGHAGTLDPFATGLLVVMAGQATKLSPYLTGENKTYRAVMKLGEATDTLDRTGRIVKRMDGPFPAPGEITDVLKRFTGALEQTPPMYSAVKHHGVRAYRLARKGIEVPLRKRCVKVFVLELLEYDPPFATLEVHCTSGTYIRTLAADIGEALGTAAHLTALRRLSVGTFDVTDAVASIELRGGSGCREMIAGSMTAPADALHRMASIEVSPELAARIRRGYRPSMAEVGAGNEKSIPTEDGLVKVVAGRELIAVCRVTAAGGSMPEDLIIERVFLSV